MAIYVSNEELHGVLQTSENDRLDFKSSDILTEPNEENRYKIAKHIVGFANHKGGKLVFGVNDDQEPEGEDIDEEKALGTISSIISSKISPVVDFTYTFYSSDQDDLSTGSVFILEIPERSASIPLAIIEKAGDKIKKREYRIRSGESTRHVSNEELLALFKRDADSKRKLEIEIIHLLDHDYSPAELKYKPIYQYTFERHFDELGNDDESLINKISGDLEIGTKKFSQRMYDFQHAIVLSSILLEPEFSMIWEGELVERMDDDIDELSFDLKSISPDNVSLEGDSNPLINNTEMERLGILPSYDSRLDHFQIPNESEVVIWENFDGFSITNDEFSLNCSIDLLEVGVGLPKRHPESPAEFGTYEDIQRDSSKCTMSSQITIERSINYPNHEYSEYESYRAYCESFIERFEDTYCWESYVDQLPDEKLIKIEEIVEDINSKLDQTDGSSDS